MLFITLSSWAVLAKEDSSDRSDILAQNRAFSQAFINGDVDKLMAIYTPNARIISGDKKITSDNLAIRKY